MIYSINYMDMVERINPLEVTKYLNISGWKSIPYKREGVKIYQNTFGDLQQVIVPMRKDFIDYKNTMYKVIQTIADVENKSIEQVMLYLLNPNTDILKIRLDRKDIEPGNILFDDAISLFENAKKLLAATALDIINPKKIHYGRIDDAVTSFLNQCRFGQTEIGSYIVSIVCPFAELDEKIGYKQLSIFSDEEECANSLTRKVTNKLMSNIHTIKSKIDADELAYLYGEDSDISSNFFEALSGLNFQTANTTIEFIAEWSPIVKSNRCKYSKLSVTNDYYQPISSIASKIKGESSKRTEIVGRIKQLSATPVLAKRTNGLATIVYIGDDNKVKSVKVELNREDYDNAVIAHQKGCAVKIIGDIECKGKNKSIMQNALFSVI